jgi:hypothetical protein
MALKIKDNVGVVVKVPSMKEVNDRITARIQDPTGLKTINGTVLYGSGNLSLEPAITAGIAGQYWDGTKTWEDPDLSPTTGSDKLITSGAVADAIAQVIAGGINFDTTIAAGGTNAVQSGVIYTEVKAPLTTHIADTTIHVTSTDKTNWSGKQDAIMVNGILKGDGLGNITAASPAVPGTDGTHANGGVDGLMSSADKFKLDGIEVGSQENVVETISVGGTNYPADSSKHVSLPAYPIASNATITINSANSTSQTPGADTFTLNQASGTTVNLHEVSKTGDYGDLLNTPNWQDVVDLQNNKLDKTFAPSVVTTSIWEQSTTVVTNKVTGLDPAGVASPTNVSYSLPRASASQIGLMTFETFQALDKVILDVDTLKGASARYLIDLNNLDGVGTAAVDPQNPTQGELQIAYEHASGTTGVAQDGVILVDPNYNLSFQWFATSNEWVSLSAAQVQIATTTAPGIVLSTEDDMATTAANAGKISVDLNGAMSVIGWDVLNNEVLDNTTAIGTKQDKLSGTAGHVVTYGASAGVVGSLAIDSAVTASSNNLISSGAVHNYVGNGTLVVNLITDDGLGVAGSVNTVSTLNFTANQSNNATPFDIPVPLEYIIGTDTGNPEDDWTT